MKILNVREGFACNSSSTHSIVFTSRRPKDNDVESGFNWNYFVASSQEAKMSWLGARGRIRVSHDRSPSPPNGHALQGWSSFWFARVSTSSFSFNDTSDSDSKLEELVAAKLESIVKQASDLLRESKSREP